MSDESTPASAANPEVPHRVSWWRFLVSFGKHGRGDPLAAARRFVQRHNFARALSAYQRALEADPHNAKAHQGIALLQLRKGGREHLQAALGHVLEAVQIDPYDPQNYRINAAIFQRLGNGKRVALELRCMAITHTLRRQPEHPIAHNQMGVLLLRLFRADLAMGHFERAVQAQPRYEGALRNLARTCCARAEAAGDSHVRADLLNSAAGHVQKALDVAPSAAAWATLARIRLMSGQAKEAWAAVEEAQQIQTPCPELAGIRAEVQLALAMQPASIHTQSPNSPAVGVA